MIEYIENSKGTPCYCDFTGTKDNLFLPEGVSSNPRQRRKIVGCFRNPKLISQRDVNISEKELDSFFLEVARKKITDKKTKEKDFQNLVSRIKGNILKIRIIN